MSLVQTTSPTAGRTWSADFFASLVVFMVALPLCVAIAEGRPHLAAVRASKHFAVSVLDAESCGVMNRFFRPPPPGQTPFDGLEVENAPKGCPVIRSALAWLECRCAGEHATGDHIVVFGEVTTAALLRPGDPSIHLRKNGLGY